MASSPSSAENVASTVPINSGIVVEAHQTTLIDNTAVPATSPSTEAINMASTEETTTTSSALIIDTTGMLLTAKDKTMLDSVKTWWKAKEEEHRKGPFPLLSLPAELRERIFTFVLTTETPQDIAKFKLPPITRASKQLRRETLPRFFSCNTFIAVVKSNFEARHELRITGGPRPGAPSSSFWNFQRNNWSARASGITRIRGPVRESLKQAGPAALFRDLKFKIFWAQRDDWPRIADEYFTSLLRLRVVKSGLHITVENGRDYPPAGNSPRFPFWSHKFTAEDVDAALKTVTDKAEEIGARAGFKGLSLKDVDEIAKKFRFVLPL